jgi:hypothetical protein
LTEPSTSRNQSYVAAPIPAPASGLPNALYRGGTDVTSTVDQITGKVVVVYNDKSSGALNMWATHTATAGDLSTFTPAQRVKPSGQTQFFPWLQSGPNGRVDLAYYDRSCDPNDVLDCVTLSSSTNSGASWSHVAVTAQGFDGDTFGACLAFVDPPDCTTFFLGDYIAVGSNEHEGAGAVDRQRQPHARRVLRERRLLMGLRGEAPVTRPLLSRVPRPLRARSRLRPARPRP